MGYILGILFVGYIIWLVLPEKREPIHDTKIKNIISFARALSRDELISRAEKLYFDLQSLLPTTIFDPEFLNAYGTLSEKTVFIVNWLKLPYTDITFSSSLSETTVAAHDLDGFVVIPVVFDYPEMTDNTILVRVESDLTYAYLDHSTKIPKVVKSNKKIILKDTKPNLWINANAVRDPNRFASVLFHEMSHLFLFYHGLQPADFGATDEERIKKEIETDIATVLMGGEKIMTRYEHGSYLSRDQFLVLQTWYTEKRLYFDEQ